MRGHVPQIRPDVAEAEHELTGRVPGRERAAVDQGIEDGHAGAEDGDRGKPPAQRAKGQPRGPQPPRHDHGHDGAAEYHDVGVADEGRDLDRREPGEAGQVRRRGLASVASSVHSRVPEPAAISEASVNVGM